MTETEIICPEAMYCVEGSALPVKCEAGTYTDYEGATACTVCPAGSYCIPDLIVEGKFVMLLLIALVTYILICHLVIILLYHQLLEKSSLLIQKCILS